MYLFSLKEEHLRILMLSYQKYFSKFKKQEHFRFLFIEFYFVFFFFVCFGALSSFCILIFWMTHIEIECVNKLENELLISWTKLITLKSSFVKRIAKTQNCAVYLLIFLHVSYMYTLYSIHLYLYLPFNITNDFQPTFNCICNTK